MALDAGCHVFTEKPLAESAEQCRELVELARAKNTALVVGYILRQHPSWIKFVEVAKTLGKPLVMRMNLNQQSYGKIGKHIKVYFLQFLQLLTVVFIMWM